MTSVQTREERGRRLYECYRAEKPGKEYRLTWEAMSFTIRASWERIASRYHEKTGRHG